MISALFSQIDKEQAELARANFSTLRKEAQIILDLVSSSVRLTSVYSCYFSTCELKMA